MLRTKPKEEDGAGRDAIGVHKLGNAVVVRESLREGDCALITYLRRGEP